MADQFPDLGFLNDDGLERSFQAIDVREAADPWMAWRIKLNTALAEEGINISWLIDGLEDYVLVQPRTLDAGMKDYEKIPIMHLRELYDYDIPANPYAVAMYIKAVLYDKRFRLWEYESED